MFIASFFVITPIWKQHRYIPQWDIQPVAHPYQVIPLSNKKEHTFETGDNLDVAFENYAE